MSEPNRDQAALWNTSSGSAWVEMQGVLDAMYEPIAARLVDEAFEREGARFLDIGCGAGATTLAMARRLGAGGSCVGVDISAPLVAAAKARAAAEGASSVSFVEADAQTYAFEPDAFDGVISRFGVMFFDDPEGAFANIGRAVRRGSRLTFVAWRSPDENPFLTAAARAASPLIAGVRMPSTEVPGQWAFADGDRVQRILRASGWSDVDVRPLDVETRVGDKDLLAYVTKLGPVGLALRDTSLDDATRARVIDAVRAAFDSYMRDGIATSTSACWLVTARR